MPDRPDLTIACRARIHTVPGGAWLNLADSFHVIRDRVDDETRCMTFDLATRPPRVVYSSDENGGVRALQITVCRDHAEMVNVSMCRIGDVLVRKP